MKPYFKPIWRLDDDDWIGNGLDANGVDWTVTVETGWFSPVPVRSSDQDRPTADGVYSDKNLRGARVISLTGRAEAPDEVAIDHAVDQFNALLGDGELHPLRVDEPVKVRRAMVKLGDLCQLSRDSAYSFDFQLIMVAPDPRKFSDELLSASTLLASQGTGGIQWGGGSGGFGILWSGSAGITGLDYGVAGEAGSIVIDNSAGTAPADIVFTMTGPVPDPWLQRADTGQRIEFGGTIAEGDPPLRIDTGSGSVTQGGVDVGANLTKANFFTVPPKRSISVAYGSSGSNPVSILTAEWRTATR